ncbi:MAG TPA: PAS domain-containing sensor histidine kinase [Gammaproteobacteria bacterium]|nr:PAS domain-containing sensor histidine kinase [Gammaproteobacteria bacterium]
MSENNTLEVANLINITNIVFEKHKDIPGEQQSLSIEETIEKIIGYYESIIGCMPGNVYWLDKNLRMLGCNNNVLAMFGLNSSKEIKGLNFEEMGKIGRWSPETTQSLKADFLEVIRTGKAKANIEEPPIPHSDGGILYFLSSRVPLFDDNGFVVGIVGISIDITDRTKFEQFKIAKEAAELANNAKTEFLENMRHDIRTPLSGIIGFAELLRNETNPSKIKDYTTKLVESSTELLNFLNEILESVHITSGEIPLVYRQFNLKHILDSLSKLYQPKAHEKQLTLEFHCDEKISPYLIGDPTRIYRIILELLGNALKFTQQGKVNIYAKLAKKNEQNTVIQIEVEDTGPGIAAENQHEIFVRFKRFTPSSQGIYQGSGLGLSIVKQFIEDLQGEIYYDTKNTKGAKFICLIPLKEALLQKEI